LARTKGPPEDEAALVELTLPRLPRLEPTSDAGPDPDDDDDEAGTAAAEEVLLLLLG
jgi:hypothetical protein